MATVSSRLRDSGKTDFKLIEMTTQDVWWKGNKIHQVVREREREREKETK